MDRHLVAIKVSVKGCTDQWVQLDRLAFDQLRLKRLDAETVKCRCAVQQNRVLANNFFQNVPDFRLFFFHQLLCRFDRTGQAFGVEAGIDERFEQLERHLLRKTAFMQFHVRANHNDRTTRIVDALTKQVLTETTMLAFEHVRQRLQRTLIGAGNGPTTTAIVEQSVNRFLQHPLFVADDDVWRAQLHQALQTVIPVDHAAIEVVQVRGRKAATIQRHQWAQIWGNDRHDIQDHPFWLGARRQESLNDFQAFGIFLRLQLRRRFREIFPQRVSQKVQVQTFQNFFHRFRTDHRGEGVFTMLVLKIHIFFFSQQLLWLERGQSRFSDDVALKVQHALNVFQRHVEQRRDTGWQRFQEPDVSHRRGQLNVSHPLTTDFCERDFHTAFLTDNTAILDPLILTAKTLIVLDRSENPRAEQTVALRLERPVIDRLWLLDLT